MKRMTAVSVIFMIAFLLLTPTAHSTTYVFQPTSPNLEDLYHRNYYTWGIQLGSPLDGTIVSAVMFVDGLYNRYYSSYPNDLWVHLLDDTASRMGTDYGTGDYFKDQGELIFHAHNWSGPPLSIEYGFSDHEIDLLNAYAENLNFGFGFDPDCYFVNRGVSLTLVTAKVPEPATWMLLALGSLFIAVIEITRLVRYLKTNRSEPEFRHVLEL